MRVLRLNRQPPWLCDRQLPWLRDRQLPFLRDRQLPWLRTRCSYAPLTSGDRPQPSRTYESGLFYSQVADGISGFSQAETYGPTLFDYLRKATNAPDVFSMCLSETHGALVLGAAVPVRRSGWRWHRASCRTVAIAREGLAGTFAPTRAVAPQASLQSSNLWVPYGGGGSYSVAITDLRIAGKSVGAAASRYSSTIVDSGTTFMCVARRPTTTRRAACLPFDRLARSHAQGRQPSHLRIRGSWRRRPGTYLRTPTVLCATTSASIARGGRVTRVRRVVSTPTTIATQ